MILQLPLPRTPRLIVLVENGEPVPVSAPNYCWHGPRLVGVQVPGFCASTSGSHGPMTGSQPGSKHFRHERRKDAVPRSPR